MIKRPNIVLLMFGLFTLVSVTLHVERISNKDTQATNISKWKPLDTKPLLNAELITQNAARVDVLNEILLRDPRNRHARLELIRTNLAVGLVSEALEDITILYRLDPENQEAFKTVLVALYSDKASRDELLEFSRKKPQWMAPLTAHIIQNFPIEDRDSLDLLLNIFVEGEPNLHRRRGIVQRYLNRLVAIEEFRQARGIWLNAFELSYDPSIGLVYNPSFSELVATPPFNWEIRQPERISVYSEVTGGLRIVARNVKPEAFAKQLLPIPVTDQVIVEARMKDLSGPTPEASLEVQLKCKTEKGGYANVWVRDFSSSFVSDYINIPDTCSWLMLEIFILPGSQPLRSTFHLDYLQISNEKPEEEEL